MKCRRMDTCLEQYKLDNSQNDKSGVLDYDQTVSLWDQILLWRVCIYM